MAAGNYTTTSHKPYEGEMLTDEQLTEYVAIAHMRNTFEQHFKLTLRQARRTKDGIGYQNPDIQARWEGWQAALAAAPVAQEPVATVLWHNGEKIIDGSMAFMDTAPIGKELYAAPVAAHPTHPDDLAVDRFAAAMKAKMAASRAKGRNGWDNAHLCPVERLQGMLIDHLAKGDPVDIGNFAMMLWNRGEPVAAAAPVAVPDVLKLDDDDEVRFPNDTNVAVIHADRYWQLRAIEDSATTSPNP